LRRPSQIVERMTHVASTVLSIYYIIEHAFSQSGYPLVVVVEPSQYRDSHHFVPRIGRRTRRTTQFRELLLKVVLQEI